MNNSSPQKQRPASKKGHITPCQVAQVPSYNGSPSPPSLEESHIIRLNKKMVIRYKECLKNHAAAIGGNATDGCGEFMPSGEEGTLEALNCSACNCHRNFHRKEIQCDYPFDCYYHSSFLNINGGGKHIILGPNNYDLGSSQGYPTGTLIISSRQDNPVPHQMTMPYKNGLVLSESDEKDDHVGEINNVANRPNEKARKRFRTKFTQEQKEKLLSFAEKAGWRIQKLEESVVQQFCQEIGVKRRVLKVWMHNNKHSLAKKLDPIN